MDELANDMVAAATVLARRPNVEGHHVGLMGTSQAGWIMVAAIGKTPVIRFAIAVTGSVEPVGVNIAYESQRALPIDDAYAQLARFDGAPGCDPAPTLARLTLPTLWLLGAEDRLVPTRDCVRILQSLQGQGAPVSFTVFPGVGHGLPGASYWPTIDAFLPRALSS